jgi:hypothetical protein
VAQLEQVIQQLQQCITDLELCTMPETYENLTKNLELQALEAQLQEVKQHADTLQVQLKALTPVKRMKRFAEQSTTQQ